MLVSKNQDLNNYSNAKNVLCETLKVLPSYCIEGILHNFVECFLNGKWLKTIIRDNQYTKPPTKNNITNADIYSSLQLNKNIGEDWHKYLIQVLPKENKEVYPLSKNGFTEAEKMSRKHQDLSYTQLLNYVNKTNTQILWKDSYLRYPKHSIVQQWKEGTKVNLEPFNKTLLTALICLLNCPVITISGESCLDGEIYPSSRPHIHSKFFPVICILESKDQFFLIMEPDTFSLYQCINFSPAKLKENDCASLFLVYQLCQAVENIHDCGLFLGNVSLHHLRLDPHFHLSVIPDFLNALLIPPENIPHTEPCSSKDRTTAYLHFIHSPTIRNMVTQCDPLMPVSDKLSENNNKTLLALTQLWATHEISNFDYLLCLSFFAGHSFDSPSHYPCVPWVTDFTSASDGWRDLTKTKYRLNKGDQQLNHTYQLPQEHDQIAHHIPEFFSEVTYYVYKARRTAKEVLQKHVRQHFVASHYPSSIGRMYALTPEECIPEFYCDPQVFRSLHEDMADLEVPSWCTGVEDFIRFHRSCLESNYVSRRLHHWIDLYYGYKLTGSASIKAKNVCLGLVDGHTTLARGGVVQLFNVPHTPKFSPSPFLSKAPPPPFKSETQVPDPFSTVLPPSTDKKQFSKSNKSRSSADSLSTNQTIELPPNYNPMTALNQLEMLFTFSLKTNTTLPPSEVFHPPDNSPVTPKQLTQERTLEDLRVLGCLMVQIFCPLQCRTLPPNCSLSTKFEHCKRIFVHSSDIPRSLHSFLSVSFGLEDTGAVSSLHFLTSKGLPPPTSFQLLQPLVDAIPFASFFRTLTLFINNLRIFQKFLSESESETKLKEVESFIKKIGRELKELFPQLSGEGVKLLVPYLVQLYEHPVSAPIATLHLTHIILQTLDPLEAQKHILPFVVRLFECEAVCRSFCHLFQRNFILTLLTGFGLKVFLNNFTTPIIEAIGGYKQLVDDSRHDNRNISTIANLRSVEATSIQREQLGLEDDTFVHSNSDSLERPNATRSSSTKTPSGAETDITDVDNDTDMFVFESCDDEDDNTIGDFGGTSFATNEQTRSLHASDTDSGGECSLQDGVSMASPCPSPLSLCTEDDVRSNEDSLQLPSGGEKHESLAIPIPNWTLPYSLASPGECSKSLPDVPCSVASSVAAGSVSMAPQISHDRCSIIHLDDTSMGSNATLSELSFETLVWLAHKLGPVLTARHISRNLLRMLTLCYSPETGALVLVSSDDQDPLSVTHKKTLGDSKASKVFASLIEIAKMYGEHFILVQYFNHITELVSWCGSKLSPSQEGALIGAMSLLQHLIAFLSDTTFMDHLQETLIRNAVYPVIRLLSSLKVTFPSGAAVRTILAWRVIDCLCLMAKRVGREMTKEKLAPAITRFLTAFDKVCGDKAHNHQSPIKVSEAEEKDKTCLQEGREKAVDEMKQVFTPELAHLSYIPLCKFLGSKYMEETLSNHDLLRSLCIQFDENSQADHAAELTFGGLAESGSQGSNVVAVIGNRIDIQGADEQHKLTAGTATSGKTAAVTNTNEILPNRHLKGNWLAYWEHEVGRNEQDSNFNLKQIKLQSFVGHSSSVKALCALDTENSFISASKDKTVKLWSIRSQGDGSSESTAKWTYSNHKKSVFDVSFCDPLQLVASCDSTVHIWDPFTGTCLKQLDSLKHSPVTVLSSMSAPSTELIAATTDSTLKIIDLRTCSYAHEMRITTNSVGIVRCLTSSYDSKLVAVAHSSGVIATLDLRTGQLLATWKPHEGEVLTLQWYEKGTFISTALDQTISVWSVFDKKLKFSLKGPTEPVHLLKLLDGEIVSGTTANRLGVHTAVSPSANFSSTRLRSETVKGVVTAMHILPLNRQLLLGTDNGAIHLLC